MSSAPKVQAPLWRIQDWFKDLNAETSAQLALFHRELLNANKMMSLIPAKTVLTADQAHFAECIMASQLVMQVNPEMKSIWTFGSGNGFPGIIFAILYPKVVVEVNEPEARKIEFLKSMVSILKLSNLNIQNTAFERIPANSVQNSLCRGFADMTKTMMAFRAIVPSGGNAYSIKAENWGVELSRVPTQLCSLWEPKLIKDFQVPLAQKKSSLINIKRI